MKVSTWIPKHAPLPRTLADVPSSRENPVLVWWNDYCVLPAYVNEHGMVKAIPKVGNQFLGGAPEDHFLYSTPSRPTKLDDVDDRRVVLAEVVKAGGTRQAYRALFFRESGTWYEMPDRPGWEYSDVTHPNPDDWRLTDHCVELVETEIGVV